MTDHKGFYFLDMRRQQDRRQHRRHREGCDDGTEQRIGIGPRHRPEDLTFHTLHREKRQEGCDRDDNRKEDRLVDLDCPRQDPTKRVAAPHIAIGCHAWRVMGDMTEDVFNHDHGSVDDNAEIDGTHRQKIRRLSSYHRDDHREEERYWNRCRDDQRAAQVPEKDPLDQEDQGNTEQEIVQYRLHRDRNEVAAIVECHDLDAGRQRSVGVDQLDSRAYALDHLHGTFKLLHQDDTGNDISRLVTACKTEPGGIADLDLGDIRHQHGNATLLGEHDIADIVRGRDDADAADIDGLFADRDGAAADIGVAR